MFNFNKTAVGIDIDDRSLEIVELKSSGAHFKVAAFSRVVLPPAVVEQGRVKDQTKLSVFLKQALKEAKPHAITPGRLAVVLPESQTFSFLSKLAPHPLEQRPELIKAAAKKNFPLAAADLTYFSRVVKASPRGALVLLVGMSSLVREEWLRFFAATKLEVDILEPEIFAVSRDLALTDPAAPYCLVDLGAIKTNITVLKQGTPYYSTFVNVGGNHFTKRIARQFNLKVITAERKKMQLGLNRQIYPLLAESLLTISQEISGALRYYRQQFGEPVKEAVLVGGSGRLKGLPEYLQDKLKLPVNIGRLKSLSEKFPLEYYGAIGLAARALEENKYQHDPQFSLKLTSMKKTTAATAATAVPPAPATPTLPVADNNEEQLTNNNNQTAWQKKLAWEKKVLLIILVVGAGLIAAAFWYRNQSQTRRAAEFKQINIASFNQSQSFDFTATVNLKAEAVGVNEIRGRIIEDQVESAAGFSEALNQSRSRVNSGLNKEETLWREPLNEIINQASPSFPLTFRWLAFSSKDALRVFSAKFDELNKTRVAYNFNNLEWLAATKSASVDTVNLSGRLTVNLNNLLTAEGAPMLNLGQSATPPASALSPAVSETAVKTESPENSPAAPAGAGGGKKVLIKQTETGWLNVRQGAGTTYPLVQKLDPGGTYEVLAEQGDWVKIKISDTVSGWVAARYTQVQ